MARSRAPRVEVLFSDVPTLLSIAREAAAELRRPWPQLTQDSPTVLRYVPPPGWERNTLTAIAFAAFAAEGFINHYGALWVPRATLDGARSTMLKWTDYPEAAGKRGIPEDVLTALADVFEARDGIAHPKAKWLTPQQVKAWGGRRSGRAEQALSLVGAVERAIRALAEVDPRVDVAWMDGGAHPMNARVVEPDAPAG